MHVEELQGIQVQVDNTGGKSEDFYILHLKWQHGTLRLAVDLVEFGRESLPVKSQKRLHALTFTKHLTFLFLNYCNSNVNFKFKVNLYFPNYVVVRIQLSQNVRCVCDGSILQIFDTSKLISVFY